MPYRNSIKFDVEQSYYHIYARGASKQTVFLETSDYLYFENLFARYLSKRPTINKEGSFYPHLTGKIELLAYCFMGNHFHLLVYQNQIGSMTRLMRGLMTSYSRYFNLKYDRTGSLFESRYKAAIVDKDTYLQHISRYIHLNPRYWRTYRYSSLQYYKNNNAPEWLVTNKVSMMFKSPEDYLDFIQDYEEYKKMLEEIKQELADE